MDENLSPKPCDGPNDLQAIANEVNEALKQYSDKDWNYSRISLESCPLESIDSPYVLWIERVDAGTKHGLGEVQALKEEIAWGTRHSSELGIAELISLRINRALAESNTKEHWGDLQPVVRLVKRELLAQQGIVSAFWYKIREVSGEEFDNR
jgi:hypothetical protein